MGPPPSSKSHLLAILMVGVGFNVLSLLFPTIIPQAGRRPNTFSIMGATALPTTAEVFVDFGNGIFPDQSSRQAIIPSLGGPVELTFTLPAGKLYGLRFDPTENDQVSSWKNARIRDEEGRLLYQFEPADFIPVQQIDSLTVEGDTVRIVPPKGAFDSFTQLRLRHPVDLPDDSAASRKLQAGNFAVQRGGALMLAVTGLILARLAWTRRGQAQSATPSRRLAGAALAFAALSITYFRRPSIFLAPQMMVEDGVVFFLGQWTYGWKAVLMPYAGYLHLMPRLVAGFAMWFPLAWTPRVYGCCALLVLVATVIKAASPRSALPLPYWCALAVVMVPNMDEITAFAVNIQWWGAVFLVLVSISAPARNRGELARDILAVVVFGLSGPWALLLSPFLAYRAWRARTGGAIATAAVAVAVGLVQYHFNVAYPPLPPTETFWHSHALPALAGLGYRIGGQLAGYLPLVSGTSFSPWEYYALATWLLLIVLIPVPAKYRGTRLMLAGVAIVVVAATVLRCRYWEYMLFSPPICQRYLFLPLTVTLWILIIALGNSTWRRALPAAVLILIAARNIPYFRMPPVIDFHWARYADVLERGEGGSIPIYPAGWSVKLGPRHQ